MKKKWDLRNLRFEKENSRSIVIMEAPDKVSISAMLQNNDKWFQHEDNKNILHVINMREVRTFHIEEYKKPRVAASSTRTRAF